jgi:hypothetical protein
MPMDIPALHGACLRTEAVQLFGRQQVKSALTSGELEYNGYAAHARREEVDEARRRDIERRGWIVVDADVEDRRSASRLEKELDEAFIARGVDVRGRTPRAMRPRRHRERRPR